MTCGNNICEGNENSTCPQDCNICGDDKCDYDENKTTCPIDCAVCGDSVCDPFEITGLHKTSCVKDCATCGDGYCDSGESSSCDTDCRDKIQGVFMGYLIIPLIIAILLIIFEITRHYATHGRQKAAEAKEAAQTLKDAARKTKLKRMEPGEIMPYLLLFSAGLAVTTILLAFLGISYEKNLAILDLGNYLINNGPIISLIILALAAGIGMLARATYYMERNQAISLSLIFAVLGLVPGLLIFLNLEYMVLMAGLIVGTLAATITIKKDEVEYAVKKPFKMGSEAADKMLTIAAVFACILILLQLYTDSKTSDKLSSAIWQSQTTKAMVKDSFGPQENEKALRDNVVEPFFNSTMGGVNGQLVFAIGAAILLLVILKVFITVIKLLAGFFAWLLDKSGFVK